MCSASIDAWLHSAMRPLIKELDITLYTVHNFCFSLPQNISKCSNLVSLSLKGALSFKPQQPKSFSLPSLKTLGLDICGIDASSLNEFLQGCPCLETLDFYWYVEDCARICVPPLCLPSSLKSFKFVLRKHSSLSLSATQRLLEKSQTGDSYFNNFLLVLSAGDPPIYNINSSEYSPISASTVSAYSLPATFNFVRNNLCPASIDDYDDSELNEDLEMILVIVVDRVADP
ncbi:hypothetical protein RYX36_013086 [Vicia faba]